MGALFGSDIALNSKWQPRITASGELVIVEEADTAVQDIALRLYTVLGSLWYDINYGSEIMMFVRDESTALNRPSLALEVERRCNEDPAVEPGTVSATVRSWGETSIQIQVEFTLISETHSRNLVVSINDGAMMILEGVLADVATS